MGITIQYSTFDERNSLLSRPDITIMDSSFLQQQGEMPEKLSEFIDLMEIYIDERWVSYYRLNRIKKNKSVSSLLKKMLYKSS